MRFIEENLETGQQAVSPPFNRDRLQELEGFVSDLAKLYQELGLKPHSAWRSALADFAGDFPGEVAVLHRVSIEA